MQKRKQNNRADQNRKQKRKNDKKEINRKNKINNLMNNMIKCFKIQQKIHKWNLKKKEQRANNKRVKINRFKANMNNRMIKMKRIKFRIMNNQLINKNPILNQKEISLYYVDKVRLLHKLAHLNVRSVVQ